MFSHRNSVWFCHVFWLTDHEIHTYNFFHGNVFEILIFEVFFLQFSEWFWRFLDYLEFRWTNLAKQTLKLKVIEPSTTFSQIVLRLSHSSSDAYLSFALVWPKNGRKNTIIEKKKLKNNIAKHFKCEFCDQWARIHIYAYNKPNLKVCFILEAVSSYSKANIYVKYHGARNDWFWVKRFFIPQKFKTFNFRYFYSNQNFICIEKKY